MCQSKFGIAVSSEVMAILSIFNGLADFKKRMNEIVVA
jgi:formate--tetrahydrofolate ligase